MPTPADRDPQVTPPSVAATNDAAGLTDAYARVRRIARRLMTYERAGHTLSATDVVHEAMARLLDEGWGAAEMVTGPRFVQLVQHAARAMTQVLVDHARRRGAVKRGGGRRRVDLDDVETALDAPGFDWLALDEALETLRVHDPRRHSVVVLRFFAGLDNRQIAAQLAVDERTIGRDWTSAKLWLRKRLAEQGLTTAEINAAWKKSGRGGVSDNTLGKLVREKKLKREKVKDGRRSSYSVA